MPKSKATTRTTKKTLAQKTGGAKPKKSVAPKMGGAKPKKSVAPKIGSAKPKKTRAQKIGGAKPIKTITKETDSTNPRKTAVREEHTEEYAEYLERYELYGEGRPHLSPSEFERLDEELLDLLALETEQGVLTDEQIVRLQELEFLLLDSEQ